MIPQLNPTLSFLPNVSLTFEGQVICKKSPMAVFMYPIEQIRLRIQFWFICIGQIMIWSHLGSVSKKIEDFWKTPWPWKPSSKVSVLLRKTKLFVPKPKQNKDFSKNLWTVQWFWQPPCQNHGTVQVFLLKSSFCFGFGTKSFVFLNKTDTFELGFQGQGVA